jgi:hypothetical protein
MVEGGLFLQAAFLLFWFVFQFTGQLVLDFCQFY